MPKAYLDFKTDRSSIMDGLYEHTFTITSREDYNTITSSYPNSWRISTDGGMTWEHKTGTLCILMKGQTCMIMGRDPVINNTGDVPIFNGQYTFDVSGDIRSLNTEYLIDIHNPQETDDSLQDNAFRGLLKNSNVVDASRLKLPDTTLANNCYAYMFYGCTSLKNPPALPATTLTYGCYYNMFAGCNSLVYAPELQATTLADYCYTEMFYSCLSLREAPQLPATTVPMGAYDSMFKDCISLQMAPELPATTLESNCYAYMFDGCTSLTSAPELPAKSLPTGCYAYMFQNCSNLSYIKIRAESRASNSLSSWVKDVADFGIFVKSPFATYPIDNISGVPIGWTLYDLDDEISDMYNVTISVSPADAGYVIGGGYHRRGTTVTLKAIPYEGYVFNRWTDASGNILSRSNTYSFTLNEPIRFYAMFVVDSGSIEYESEYFTIESEENDNKVYINSLYNEASYQIHYKINNGVWETIWVPFNNDQYTDGTIVSRKPNLLTTLDIGDKLYLGTDLGKFDNRRIYVEKKHKISGNVLSLVAYSGSQNSTSTVFYYDSNYETFPDAFSYTFADDTTLTDAYNLIIPDVAINEYSFSRMFRGCTSLLRAPSELSPVFLDEFCYESMFEDCTSLIVAPILPATTMERSCYSRMFWNCTSLVEAPELPATTLAYECYQNMFNGCSSLLYAPDLNATILTEYCYELMFGNCTSLLEAPELPALTMQRACYSDMFAGCTGLIEAPELPATTLAYACYEGMFNGCTFSQSPLLLASNVPDKAYCLMFANNPNLNYIYILATQYDDSETGSLWMWAMNVAPTGIFIKHPDTDYLIDNINGVPPGWTVRNYDNTEVVTKYTIQLSNANNDAGTINMYTIENGVHVDHGTRARFVEGTTVYLEATPNSGYTFTKWQKENGTTFSYSNGFEVTENLKLTAIWSTYSDTYYTVTVRNNNINMGTVTGAGTKRAGTMAYLNAVPMLGYAFDKFIDNDTGEVYTSSYLPITVTRNMYFTVYWKESNAYAHMYFTVENTGNSSKLYMTLGYPNVDNNGNIVTTTHSNTPYSFEYMWGDDGIWRKQSGSTLGMEDIFVATFRDSNKISIRNFKASGTLRIEGFKSDNNFNNSTYHITAYGNIMSLYEKYMDKTNSTDTYFVYNNHNLTIAQEFKYFFHDMNIIDASKIVLPATSLTYECYSRMFEGRTRLNKIPTLPATSLAYKCYAHMFDGCTSLVSINDYVLPATSLTNYCYFNMFKDCTLLSTVPSNMLPATTLATHCYDRMFNLCKSLVTAPVLPATTLANHCYDRMFIVCESLNYVKAMFTSDPATLDSNGEHAYTEEWLSGVASNGTFVKNSSASWTLTGDSGIPSNWTVQTASE